MSSFPVNSCLYVVRMATIPAQVPCGEGQQASGERTWLMKNLDAQFQTARDSSADHLRTAIATLRWRVRPPVLGISGMS
jgi:hypothetical protein